MSRGRELLVGSVIIVAVVVSLIGTLWLQGASFGRPRMPVHVMLESAAQLAEGNTVTYRGVRVGQVHAISVEPGGNAVRVTVLLQHGLPLPEDAGVVLGPESLFGDWQAEIVSRSVFPRFPFFELPEGLRADTLVLPGFALPELSRLTATAEQISQNVADLTDRFELAFNQETANDLARAIDNIEAITQEVRTFVQQQTEVAQSITSSADSALSEIQIAAQAARRSFERVEGSLSSVAVDSILENVNQASSGLRVLAETLNDADAGLAATLGRADSSLVRLDRITARLEAGEGSLGRLLVDTTFAVRAEASLLQLDLLLQDIRENPRRYVRLSIF